MAQTYKDEVREEMRVAIPVAILSLIIIVLIATRPHSNDGYVGRDGCLYDDYDRLVAYQASDGTWQPLCYNPAEYLP